MKEMWEIKQQAEKPEELEVYIYGDVESDGWGWFGPVESETSANHFRNMLAEHPDVKEIKLYINSYGGSVFEGTAIYNQLKRHPAHVTAYVDGFACSIASVIAMAADTVIMPKNALMMIHNMWMWCCGNTEELRKAADDLEVINRAGRMAYLEKAGDKLTEEKLAEMMNAETWLTAEQAMEYGLCDEFSETEADPEQMAAAAQKAAVSVQAKFNAFKATEAIKSVAAAYRGKEPEKKKEERSILQLFAEKGNEK